MWEEGNGSGCVGEDVCACVRACVRCVRACMRACVCVLVLFCASETVLVILCERDLYI